jgi:hypothetical protein
MHEMTAPATEARSLEWSSDGTGMNFSDLRFFFTSGSVQQFWNREQKVRVYVKFNPGEG